MDKGLDGAKLVVGESWFGSPVLLYLFHET